VAENQAITSLALNDLNNSKELASKVMVTVIGGFIYDCGVYDQLRSRLLEVALYRISFRTLWATNGRLYHTIQYQYKWKRT
jgi:hypothetical protein